MALLPVVSPEARYPQAAEWLAANGFASTVDYLVAAGALAAIAGVFNPNRLLRISDSSPDRLAATCAGIGTVGSTA